MSGNTKLAVVTGAAKGIGAATVLRFLKEGRAVLACDIDDEALTALARTADSPDLATLTLDVAADDAVAQVREQVESRWGHASILVNNAGIAPKHNGVALDILDITLDEWQKILNVNLTAAMRMCQGLLDGMVSAGWGRIVNVSSSGGRTRALGPVGPAYMASKAAMLGLTRNIANDLGSSGVTANVVAPGRIDTALSASTGAAVAADYAKRVPVGRIGRPEEVAAAITFLASEDASFINGAVIDVNGGMFML